MKSIGVAYAAFALGLAGGSLLAQGMLRPDGAETEQPRRRMRAA